MSKETAAAARSTGRRIRRSTATTGAAREFRERELDSLGFLFFLRLLHGRRGAERRKRRRVLFLRRLSQGRERVVRRRGVVFRIIGLRESRENTRITRRQSSIVAFARESAEDALALRPRRLRPRSHRILNRPHRPLRARDRAHALDRSNERTNAFPIVPFARHPSRPVSHPVARASIIAIVHRARRRRRVVPRDARATTDARATDAGDRHRARWTR